MNVVRVSENSDPDNLLSEFERETGMERQAEGIVLAILAILAIWGAWQVPGASPGDTWAGIVPFSTSVALLVLSSLMILSSIRASSTGREMAGSESHGTVDILILFAIAMIYQQSFRWFGYVLPTAIVAPVVLYIFGVRSWVGLAVSVVLCPLIFHILFFVLLGVFPPYGEVFDLLDWLQG
ncbi:tripartite tricarboxylate transporter TctB family protein [Loktanella sp. Alg231-35]|uniref:tripartite tricarboxylate transporter TctB family protein n=1 Tax=Loktanella sp. Alg231-35 TaxID=1922220 RepID=UPI00131EDF49|nr:tripartite tricarboxylate transporter TctB family protein [Loktanella sp. Alg231-35]